MNFYENTVIHKNGNELIIAWHNNILKDENGEIIGSLSSGEDITDRKKKEEETKNRANELEKFYKLSLGREMRTIELKKQINGLLKQMGKPKKYNVDE
ncbi:MAG: PAS domain S-box protein [Candidatus Kapabacteria bacterium]|nr:PAS domain S-box protein [Candidatus Kapabacteria bacterium]